MTPNVINDFVTKSLYVKIMIDILDSAINYRFWSEFAVLGFF